MWSLAVKLSCCDFFSRFDHSCSTFLSDQQGQNISWSYIIITKDFSPCDRKCSADGRAGVWEKWMVHLGLPGTSQSVISCKKLGPAQVDSCASHTETALGPSPITIPKNMVGTAHNWLLQQVQNTCVTGWDQS